MHFHLPKPIHGWRAFAGEVGIIVIGVLIALGAEQLVETFHWHHEVEAERASLLQEAADMDSAIRARAAQQTCIDRRLSEIRVILGRHERSQALGITGTLGAPTRQSATRGTWQIALAGQALAHMSHEQKLAFSGTFGNFDGWDRSKQEEADAWLQMAPLNYPDLLGDADWASIIEGFSAATIANEHMRILAPWLIDQDRSQLPDISKYQAANDVGRFQTLNQQICKPILRRA